MDGIFTGREIGELLQNHFLFCVNDSAAVPGYRKEEMPLTVNINLSFNMPKQDGIGLPSPGQKGATEVGSFADMMDRSFGFGSQTNQKPLSQADGSGESALGLAASRPDTISTKTSDFSANQTQNSFSREEPQEGQSFLDEKKEEILSAIEEIADGVKETVLVELDIDEEQLEETMEILGLSFMDLLNPQNMEQVVVASAEEEPLSLEESLPISDIVMNLTDKNDALIEEALSDKGISLEEFAEFFEQVEEGEIELPEEIEALLAQTESEDGTTWVDHIQVKVSETAPEISQAPKPFAAEEMGEAPNTNRIQETVTVIRISDEDFEDLDKIASRFDEVVEEAIDELEEVEAEIEEIGEPVPLVENESTEEVTASPGEAAPVEVEAPEARAAAQDRPNLNNERMDTGIRPEAVSEQAAASSGESDFEFEQESERDSFAGNQTAGNTNPLQNDPLAAVFTPQDTNNFAESLQEASEAVARFTSQQTADIMDQIVTRASVTINETVSRMEMELNPQNLGRMIMQVQEHEGVITARLIAQNEHVRAALESHLATLQENLESKGIKVNAVEISAGTHEFERNLEEGQSNNAFAGQEEQSERESGQSRLRNLNRSDLEDADIELTEEEALVAQIMRDNGGTVDYSA
ncbi:MAG: flagellar hook-length control protein FliK [Lachnospiraceae bacterium]|nr:flagellar hook-length control protein FliK [Lachnospiraceae bacterium]